MKKIENFCAREDVLYRFDDTYYQTDRFTADKGKKIKVFFDRLCQTMFQVNLEMFEKAECFPLVWNEKNSYSSISASLDRMKYLHISEFGLDCSGKSTKNQIENKNNHYVDFWCSDGEGLDIWLEVKTLDFNCGINAQDDFDSSNYARIESGTNQIYDVRKLVDGEDFKIALFNIDMWYRKGQCEDLRSISQKSKTILEILSGYLDGRRYMGLLCGSLDLSKKNQEEYCEFYEEGIYTPCVMIAGLVLQ